MNRSGNLLLGDVHTPIAWTGIPFLLGAFFSFRLFVMLLSVRFLGAEPQTGTGITLSLNFLLLLLVAFQSLGAAELPLNNLLRLPSVRWVLFSLAFSCVSLSWGVAASQFAAIAYWCAMASDVASVTLLLRTGSPIDTIHSLMKGYVWGACAIALIAWLLPAQSDLRLGDEELLGTNQIGYLCGFAFFFAQYLMRERIGKFGIGAIILGVTLLRSLSKTTIIAFLLAEGFLLLKDRSMRWKTKLLLIAATVLIIIVFSELLVSYFEIYANSGNSPETLTGRLGIWAFVLDEAISRPWIGHGFYSVWKVIPPFGEFEARHAHNELLQQFYLYGIVGIIIMAGLYGSFFRHVLRAARESRRTFFCALMIFVLIRGLADTEPYDFSLPLWAIVMFSLLLEGARATKRQAADIHEEHGTASGILLQSFYNPLI